MARLVPGRERGGFILEDGTILEFENQAKEDEAFQPSFQDVVTNCDSAIATWHTHPEASANLSVGDWETFVQWPAMRHIIVGTDGVRFYRVHKRGVVND